MQIVLPLIVVAAILLLWRNERLRRADTGDLAAIAAVVLGMVWIARGHGYFAIAAFAGVAVWAAFRSQQFRRARMPVAEARSLLGVSDDAGKEQICEAHRRLIARVHPDKGGSAELARRVNAAREILLSEVRAQVPERRD